MGTRVADDDTRFRRRLAAARRADGFAAKLDTKSKWKVTDSVRGLVLRPDLPLDKFFLFSPHLFFSSVFIGPGRRWREFIDALEIAKSDVGFPGRGASVDA